MEITQKTITATKSSKRINRKSISEIVNIYNPLQIRDTIICYCSSHEGKGTYIQYVSMYHTHTHTHHTDKRAVLTKQIIHGLYLSTISV